MHSKSAYQIVSVTPTISTGIYASGDQIGGIQTISGAVRGNESDLQGSVLERIIITDAANQKAAMDIFFFSSSPTLVSVDNGAFDITAAELASKCIGRINIPTGNYAEAKASTNAVADVAVGSLLMKTLTSSTAAYAVAVVRATPTYAAATNLTFKYVIRQE